MIGFEIMRLNGFEFYFEDFKGFDSYLYYDLISISYVM